MRVMAGFPVLLEGALERCVAFLLGRQFLGQLLTAVVSEEIVAHVQGPLVVTAVFIIREVEFGGTLAVPAREDDGVTYLVVTLGLEARLQDGSAAVHTLDGDVEVPLHDVFLDMLVSKAFAANVERVGRALSALTV